MSQEQQLDAWKSKTEAAQILGCSLKTIERLATQKKIQKAMRRIPGRKAKPVYHPGDIEAIRAGTAQLEPFQGGEHEPAAALAPARRNSGFELLLQLLSNSGPVTPAATAPRHKLFLTLKEAVDYSGMSRGWLLNKIKAGELHAIKAGGWKIRRSDLEKV